MTTVSAPYVPTIQDIDSLKTYEDFVSVGQALTSAELEVSFLLGVLGLKAVKRYGERTVSELASSIGISKSNLYSKIALVTFYGEDSLTALQDFENLRLGHFKTAFTILKNYEDPLTLVYKELEHASDNTLSVSNFQSYLLEKYKERPRFSVFSFTDPEEAIRAIPLLKGKSDALEITVKVLPPASMRDKEFNSLSAYLDAGF